MKTTSKEICFSIKRGLPAIFFFLMVPTLSQGATYYVAKTGSDSNNCLQARSQSTPKLTIAAGLVCLARGAGDTLIIKAGTYAEFINYNQIPSGGGSWSRATTIMAAPGETVTLQPRTGGRAGDAVWFYGKSYVVFDGIIVDAVNVSVNGIRLNNGASYIRIQNTEVKNAGYACIGIQNNESKFNQFINVKVHDCGFRSRKPHHGIYLRGSGHLVERSEIYNIASHGIHLWNSHSPNDNNVVRYNHVHNNGSRGILIGSGSKNVAHNNLVHHNRADGITLGMGATPQVNNQAYRNAIYENSGACIKIYSGTNAKVYNNTCWRNGRGTVIDLGSGSIITNTLVTDPSVGTVPSSPSNLTLTP